MLNQVLEILPSNERGIWKMEDYTEKDLGSGGREKRRKKKNKNGSVRSSYSLGSQSVSGTVQ